MLCLNACAFLSDTLPISRSVKMVCTVSALGGKRVVGKCYLSLTQLFFSQQHRLNLKFKKVNKQVYNSQEV